MVSMRPTPTAARWLRERLARPRISALESVQRSYATASPLQETGIDSNGTAHPRAVSAGLQQRKEALRNAKPFSQFLTDSFNREHDYLRISITERCNLRCLYCMPEEGVPLSPPEHMLTTPEIFYLSSLFVSQGVTKIRLTGGEPTVRRDIVPLMQSIGALRSHGLRELALTTNGISLHRKLDAMVEAGLTGVNLSLDTLDPFQFQIMTRRNGFDAVMRSIERILEMNKLGANIKLKVNCVVMRGLNERDMIPFVELGREKDIEVRFIEYMPFGGNKWSEGKMISFQEMLDIIRVKYPGLRSVKGHKNDTSKTYEVPGFVGKVGFISSMTNDFCGTCNRLRITSDGNLKVCLHGNDEVSLRDMLRKDNNGQPIDQEAFERIKQIEMDRRDGRLSDETILGWGQREQELLHVIGAAVKRKAEKHADMGDLKNMTNRPMILIGESMQPSTVRTSLVDDVHFRFGTQKTYMPGAGLVRPWSSILPPRLSHPLVSLQSGRSHSRTFKTLKREGTKFSRFGKRTETRSDKKHESELKKSPLPTKHIDEEWERLEEGRRGSERAMLQDLDVSQAEERELMERQEMDGPQYDKYWARITQLGNARRKNNRHNPIETSLRAVEELQKIHIGMDDRMAQRQVCSSIKTVSGNTVIPTKLFLDHNYAETSVDKSVQAKAVQEKIGNLEMRLEIAKEQPPQHDPGKFRAWWDRIQSKFGTKMGKVTLRAMWRRNKKIAAVALKEVEMRKQLEHAWKADIHELEQTLQTFRSHLELLGPDSMETIQQVDQEKGKLSVEEKIIAVARDERMQNRYAERAQKKVNGAKKRDAVRLERGYAKVSWDNSLAATWGRDMEAGGKTAAEETKPLETPDVLESLLPTCTKQQQPKSEPERKSERKPEEDVWPKMEPIVEKNAGKGDKRSKSMEPQSIKTSVDPRNSKESMEYNENRATKGGDENARRNLEPVAREIEKQPLSDRKDIEYIESRDTASRDEDTIRALEAVARQTESRHAEPNDILPEQRDPTAELRQRQLRDIHQSIAHLKKLASGAQHEGRLRVGTARKLEDVLRELEKEAATVEDEHRLHSFIRYSNSNPDLKNAQFDPRHPDVPLIRQQRVEQKEALDALGASDKLQSVRTWPSTSPDALLPRSLSDQLKAQLSASAKVAIDDHLTVNVEADVPELQDHIFKLSQKLKQDYPLMDTLPYDVWKSKQRKTLQTWLKILIWKWQTRNDKMNAESADADPHVSQDVRALLDQMVLDHDLSQRAATRMATRWVEVFIRQEERKIDPDRVKRNTRLDWAQMDAGLGFLDDEGAVVDEEREKRFDEEKGKRFGVAKEAEKGKQLILEDLPFTTGKSKAKGYRYGASSMWKAANAAGYHTLVSRRAYSTSTDKGSKVEESSQADRHVSTQPRTAPSPSENHLQTSLPHLTSSGAAHMVSVASKPSTERTAIATGTVRFSNPTPLSLIHAASNKKGDVLSVSRIAGIMAAKHTPTLIPLCHPIALTHVGVTLHVVLPVSSPSCVAGNGGEARDFGSIVVESKVSCTGQTGVEMEALTSVMGSALSVVDMCKAVDKGISIGDVRVVLKEGGRSGTWREEGWESRGEE
ncbi:hypothetical protein PMIN07_002006 [Paraphaeosphaeria minitans]